MVYDDESAQTACRNEMNTSSAQICIALMDIQPFVDNCALDVVVIEQNFKDAGSVSLYPYNQSQILQNVKFTKKIIIAKGFAKFCDK